MSGLVEIILAEIERNGPVPFRRFMELALYEPAHGYYASGRAVIGRHGDYFTNVSAGSLFGRLLASQFEEMWDRLGRPALFSVVEQGAHSGDFAQDVLVAAKASPDFWDALRYRILEPFPVNSERQQTKLAEFRDKVTWSCDLADLPEFTGVHFSNELLDAMPVHLLVCRGGQWRERYVKATDGGANFTWEEGPLSTPLLEAVLPNLPAVEGYETEVNLEALSWIEMLSTRLRRGYVLIGDYGFCRGDYYHPDRTKGTLSCYREHRHSTNPLDEVGRKDITAHVEFTAVAEAAGRAGLTFAGFTDQHHFMTGLGKYAFPDAAGPLAPEQQRTMRAFATLMHPALMGRGFQFLALAKDASHRLRGFEFAGDPGTAL